LRTFGGEAAVAAEDDVDDVCRVLETLRPRLVSLLILLVLPLFIIVGKRCVEGLAEADALEEGMLGLWVHRALLVQDLLELVLIGPRPLAMRVALNSGD
jgi:hypothetical protein